MRIIGTVGLPGSGKGEAAAVAERAGIPVVTMGDVIRAETERRGLPPEEHGTVARAIREEEGKAAVAQRSIPMVEEYLDEHDTVLVDGLRSGIEVDCFQAAFGDDFTLVSVEAPFEVRATRLSERGRDLTDEDRDAVLEREQRELEFGMDEAMDRADVVITNTDSLESYRSRVRKLLDVAASDGGDGSGDETTAPDGDGPERETATSDEAEPNAEGDAGEELTDAAERDDADGPVDGVGGD